jgi:hypothetical protein
MPLVSYCLTKWCDGLMIKTLVGNERDQGSIPFTNIYYVEYLYLYIYLIHVCKCTIFRWVVDRQVGCHGGWVGRKYLLFIYLFHLYI